MKAGERMMRSQGVEGLCALMVGERIATPKMCIRDYECWHCPFDQWIEEIETGGWEQLGLGTHNVP